MAESKNIVSLVSGGWTTMASLAEKLKNIEELKLVWVIASKPWIWAIQKAKDRNIKTYILNKSNSRNYNTINDILKKLNADIVIWNGRLPLIPQEVIKYITNKWWIILNQHPWPLRKNHIDFGGKWMIWTRVTATRILYLLEVWATWDELFTETTVHIMTGEFDKWYSVWVKKLNIEQEINNYRNKVSSISNLDEKENLLRELILDVQQKLLKLEHENVFETIVNVWKWIVNKHSSYDEILVPEKNKNILEQCKQKAIAMFPNW